MEKRIEEQLKVVADLVRFSGEDIADHFALDNDGELSIEDLELVQAAAADPRYKADFQAFLKKVDEKKR